LGHEWGTLALRSAVTEATCHTRPVATPPDDPFEGEFPPGFEEFDPELQALTRMLDQARPVVDALAAAPSFEALGRSVGALDLDERGAVLIMAFIQLRTKTDPDWRDWFMRKT
jgi:hypothetical protein